MTARVQTTSFERGFWLGSEGEEFILGEEVNHLVSQYLDLLVVLKFELGRAL